MGAGIAFLAAKCGFAVTVVDADPAAVERARARLLRDVDRAGDPSILGRIDFAGAIAAVAATDLAIEAVPEDLALKRRIFAELERVVPGETILATNTSALAVDEIGADLERPERFLGLHFFNPPAAMKLVEIVRASRTDDATMARAAGFVAALDRTGIVVADTAGFIVNRVARPFYLQAMRALERGVADAATIDALVTGAGFPMGPFALMDLIGIDVNAAVSQAVYERLRVERLRPHPIQAGMIAAGTLGRKTRGGFFSYAPGAVAPAPAAIAFGERFSGRAVTLIDPDHVLEPLAARAETHGVDVRRANVGELANAAERPIIYDAYRISAGMLGGRSAAGIGVLGPLADQHALEVIDGTHDGSVADLLAPFFMGSELAALTIADVPGRVLGAIVASIVNEAVCARDEGVAGETEIDRAMQLGVRYPHGPFAWRERIGPARIEAIVEQIATPVTT
jgi:3-hydroxybutyryl-CoA dehydrogenase